MNSKLPFDVLSRVWELSDIDKDGMLDADEFAVVRIYLIVQWIVQFYSYNVIYVTCK
jgi:hypothetical protein